MRIRLRNTTKFASGLFEQMNCCHLQLYNDQELISKIMVERTNLTMDRVNNLFRDMEHLNSFKAMDDGITDEVIDIYFPSGVPFHHLVFK